MKGPIYDYERQRWTQVDTETDAVIKPHSNDGGDCRYQTPDGVLYDVRLSDGHYRNAVN